MKRLYIALALLIGVASLCIACRLTLERRVDSLLGQLKPLEAAAAAGTLSPEAARDFADAVKAQTRVLPLFLRHTELVALEDAAAQLPALPPADMPAALARLRAQLEHLPEMERLTWENVL